MGQQVDARSCACEGNRGAGVRVVVWYSSVVVLKCLLGRGHEDDGRPVGGVVDDCVVGRLGHGQQARGDVGNIEALDVRLEGHLMKRKLQ